MMEVQRVIFELGTEIWNLANSFFNVTLANSKLRKMLNGCSLTLKFVRIVEIGLRNACLYVDAWKSKKERFQNFDEQCKDQGSDVIVIGSKHRFFTK